MKLYEVPERANLKVRLISDTQVPPGAPPVVEGDIYDFSHIDGMYSFCKNSNGEVVHLVAWSEVQIENE